ncbi:hypothetical protein ACX80E_04855 [Arthrobacter sp. TMN-49]
MAKNGELVALVVLQSPAGPPRDTELTAATLARHLPEPAAIATVQTVLATAGFTVHQPVGISFSIEAGASVFQRYFGVTPVQSADGVWSAGDGAELPLDGLPAHARALVRAVVFEPPAELMGGDG